MSCGAFRDIAPGTRSSEADPAEAMAKISKAARLGPQHDKLAALAGTWDLQFKHRAGPDAAWKTESGTATSRVVLGGRYLVEELKCTYDGTPYEGVRVHGYDNLEGTYFNIWMDNLGTWPVTSRGATDDSDVLKYHGRWKDIHTPSGRPFQTVVRRDGTDKWQLELFDTIDGTEVKILEATYTRRN
ncbi:MAG: DUF1579 family protein [Planctomycetota bacterium]|jgi:hypothetical protein